MVNEDAATLDGLQSYLIGLEATSRMSNKMSTTKGSCSEDLNRDEVFKKGGRVLDVENVIPGMLDVKVHLGVLHLKIPLQHSQIIRIGLMDRDGIPVQEIEDFQDILEK